MEQCESRLKVLLPCEKGKDQGFQTYVRGIFFADSATFLIFSLNQVFMRASNTVQSIWGYERIIKNGIQNKERPCQQCSIYINIFQ